MDGTRQKSLWEQAINKISRLPVSFFKLLTEKISTWMYSAESAPGDRLIAVCPESVRLIQQSLTDQLKQKSASSAESNSNLHASELRLIDLIRQQTLRHNRNNVTRTKAYWTMFQSHPELHWALLAHMVSRNGGWNMTDLKGDLLPRLLSDAEIQSMFAFLERANGLIFHDAYPQLLLYAESKRSKESLFHLLPYLQVSSFMQPVWEQFWQHRESSPLTIALIINEQNYIEKRIVQDRHYQQTVLSTVSFLLQSFMQLNHVVFPYHADTVGEPKLAGLILEDFSDLNERIEFGKKLYAILYALPAVHQGVISFAKQTSHSGSRSDYWPELFTPIRKAPPELTFKERLTGCHLEKGAEALYSPVLRDAWADRSLGPSEPGDWFDGAKPAQVLRHMRTIQAPHLYDMTSEACFGLHKIELAILAEQTFSP